MARIDVDDKLCKGCGLCVHYCPVDAVVLSDGLSASGYHPARLKDTSRCTGCALCGKVCPDLAIEVYR